MVKCELCEESDMHTDLNYKIRYGPTGLHFFSRASGLSVLLEEVQVNPDFWSAAPRQVSIALTNACDLTCEHCYAPKHPSSLEFEKTTQWLIELDVNGCMGVGFGGGEPTLYPKLAKLCSFAMRETNLAVSMTTHAHHLNDQLLAQLKGNLNFVRVSMDGIETTYESIRGKPFKVLIDRVIALSKVVPFGINYLVNSRTINELERAINLAAKLGASEFLLLPEVPIGKRGGIEDECVEKLRAWVAQYHGSVPLAISHFGMNGLPTVDPFSEEPELASFAHIDASGHLKRTSFDHAGVLIGDAGILAALECLKNVD